MGRRGKNCGNGRPRSRLFSRLGDFRCMAVTENLAGTVASVVAALQAVA
jgi:hypothetical protein